MSLVGRYSCHELGAVLTITEANDSNGRGRGRFAMGGMTIPINLHYHFENSDGPRTNLIIWDTNTDPNQYVGGAGVSDTPYADEGVHLAGGLSVLGKTAGFSCFFKKG